MLVLALLAAATLRVCLAPDPLAAATPSTAGAPAPLKESDLVLVYGTTSARLPLVHASRPARVGIRTFIAVQNASEAARLNALYGGLSGPHAEHYVAWADADTPAGANFYADDPPPSHPLHLLGPRWAMAPMLAHEVLRALAANAAAAQLQQQVAAAGGGGAAAPPYRWLLVARDDTLWLPRRAVSLLSQFDHKYAAAISDHLIDFNGRALLAPSAAAAACLPCGLNLTAFLGRRRPPGVPQPACPVCRPAAGCEFRLDLCGALAGGPLCGTRRFMGSGDRCQPSWLAGGGGVALSFTLMSYLDKERWVSCVRDTQPSTGERSLARCLWRNGFALTHPASGLAAGLTRDVFSPAHVLFGNPAARQAVFGADADRVLGSAYAAVEAAARAAAEAEARTSAATVAALAAAEAAGTLGYRANTLAARPAAVIAGPVTCGGVLCSTRLPVNATASACGGPCAEWLTRHAVSAHLDVPYGDGAGGVGVDVAAAAAVMEAAARRVAAAPQR